MNSEAAAAKQEDERDELAHFRDSFYCAPGLLYFDGNSLGLLSKPSEASLLRVLDEWKTLGIEGWTQAQPPWFFLAETLAKGVAPLVGAEPDEVIVANSTTVNLHQLLATLYRPAGARTKMLADTLSFPSDRYALESHLRLHGLDPKEHLILVPSRDGLTLTEDDIVAAMTPEIQMAVLPSVVYTSGQLLDMRYLTKQARRRGLFIGWDCSHSIGAVPHHFREWDVDFAFWCHYKYLNSGPGAVGGLYLNRRHFGTMPGLAGWFGSRKEVQFDMSPTLTPAHGAGALQIGTPPILSMAPLQGALELYAEAGIERVRRKSLALTAYLMALVESELGGQGFAFANPREDHRRGGHVAFLHADAVRIGRALRAEGVIPDYRPPNILRLAPAPLYTSFQDCYAVVQRLTKIMTDGIYRHAASERDMVP